MAFRITYSVLQADMEEIHRQFEDAAAKVKAGFGKEFPSWIAGKAYTSGEWLENKNPANQTLLSKFHVVPVKEVNRIMDTAKAASKKWGATPWKERATLIRKAADLISERRLDLAAKMVFEAGKN